MKKQTLFTIMILSLSFLFFFSLTETAYADQANTWFDETKDTSFTEVSGSIHITGLAGTEAGYDVEKVVSGKSASASYSVPLTDDVKAAISEVRNNIDTLATGVKNTGKGSFQITTSDPEEKEEWDKRSYWRCKYEKDICDQTGAIIGYLYSDSIPTIKYELAITDTQHYDAVSQIYPRCYTDDSYKTDYDESTIIYLAAGDYGKAYEVKIKAEGEINGFSISVDSDSNGKASASKSEAIKGDEITLSCTPNSGYKLKEWQVVSGGVTVANNKFTVGTADVSIKAIFEKESSDSGQQPPQQDQPPQQEQPTDQPSEPQSDEKIVFSKLKSVKLKALSKKKIKVSWKKLSKKVRKEVKQIEIQVSTDPDFVNIVKSKILSSKKTSYTVPGLKKNTKYFIRIRAYTEKDGLKYVSEWVAKNKKTKKK